MVSVKVTRSEIKEGKQLGETTLLYIDVYDVPWLFGGSKRTKSEYFAYVTTSAFINQFADEPLRMPRDRQDRLPSEHSNIREEIDQLLKIVSAEGVVRAYPPVGSDRVLADVWLYNGNAYITEDLELTSADVLALINEQANRRRLRLEKAHALQAMTEQLTTRRQPIARDVKVFVWQRDGGRCTECGSQTDLEFDHVIPLALGGSNTARNIQLLCAACNRRKGATLG